MVQEAIKKINDEMDKEKTNPFVRVIGNILLEYLDVDPGAAEKIINKDKAIGKSLDEMRKLAETKKVGNCAMLTDQEGFEIVLKYYDIENKL